MNNEQLLNSVWTVRRVIFVLWQEDAEGFKHGTGHDTITVVGAANLRSVCAGMVEPTIKFVGYIQ